MRRYVVVIAALGACSRKADPGPPLPAVTPHVELVDAHALGNSALPRTAAYVRSKLGELVDCLAEVKQLTFADVVLQVDIGGTAHGISARQGTFSAPTNEAEDACLTRHVATWKLPDPVAVVLRLAYVKTVPRDPRTTAADVAAWHAICNVPPNLPPVELERAVETARAAHRSPAVDFAFSDFGRTSYHWTTISGDRAVERRLVLRAGLDAAGITTCARFAELTTN